MARPNVDIQLQNGALGGTQGTVDGVAGKIMTGIAIAVGVGATGLVLNTPYQIFSLDDAVAMGITEAYDIANSLNVYSCIKDFYTSAPQGAEYWFMCVANTVTLAQMSDKTSGAYAVKLLNEAQGRIRLLGFSRTPVAGYVPTITSGMDADCLAAVINAHDLANTYYGIQKPFVAFVQIRSASTIAALFDYSTSSYNSVVPLIGATKNTVHASVDFVLGIFAGLPVSRSGARIKNGALNMSSAHIANIGTFESQADAALDMLHSKGYLFFGTVPGLSGYYMIDDLTATAATDDYRYVPARRVINKATLLTYAAMAVELSDDFAVDTSGKLPPGVATAIQASVERTINQNMTAANEISSVSVFVDPAQNVLATGKTLVVVKIIPRATNKTLVIQLGYTNPANA